MASPALPPNPCLVGIVLVIKSRTGAHTIFHYPPHPGSESPSFDALNPQTSNGFEAHPPTTSSDDSEGNSSSDEYRRRKKGRTSNRVDNAKEEDVRDPEVDEDGSSPPENDRGMGRERRQTVGNNGLLFGSMGLTQLLAPARMFHKKKFELGLDGLLYLGWPVFVPEDGMWQKKKKKQARKQTIVSDRSDEKGATRAQGRGDSDGKTVGEVGEDLRQTSGDDGGTDGRSQEAEDGAVSELEAELKASDLNTAVGKGGTNGESKKETSGATMTGLTMFNVAFILNPPPLEYHLRVTEMYDNVVKKFSRALKWEQARSGYVWEQSQLILKLMRKAQENKNTLSTYYPQVLSQSTLAKALSVIYTSISHSRIAHINLTPTLSLSLQIPIPTSTSTLPTPTTPQLPGLWLTTATSLPPTDTDEPPTTHLASHFALLLLSDLPTILADITATASPLAGPLTHYLRLSTPRKSFQQIAQSSGIPLSDISFLARHLIYWRRARAIPPLHQRDTYIVSPNADISQLASASQAYARLFPALPSLPKMLSMLSVTPRPYSALIPSKDHKGAYFDILAWLMRGGWVTQLRTFAWVRVPERIKAAVATQQQRGTAAHNGHSDTDDTKQHDDDNEDDGAGPPDHPPGRLSPPNSSSRSSSSNSSIRSDRTAVPSPPLPPTETPTLILTPTRASASESHHLSLISLHILQTHGRESQEAWERCVKYFDGAHALEKIAVREGWKRGRVEAWVGAWMAEGVLVGGRWW